LGQMQAYMAHPGCLMEFLQRALDDPDPTPCGQCSNCQGKGFPSDISHANVIAAEQYLKKNAILTEPRKMWPAGIFPEQKRIIPLEMRNDVGRSLCYYGDAGWGRLVRDGKYRDGTFNDELIIASFELITQGWKPDPRPEWVTAIPSRRHPHLVPDFAAKLAAKLEIPFYPVLVRTTDAPEQKTMQNGTMQARNVVNTLAISGEIPSTPVLLVDDILDSGWTLALAGWLLRTNGSGTVYPFTLARATARNS
jgi:ATP-dependent DNA helicase RecQ